MFKVKELRTGKIKTVYHVNGTMFLFYDYDAKDWYCDDMSKYEPVDSN